MTNETRNRIEAYKKALPEMKERVMAGAFLLIMSVMMLTSASFAWITLSRAPEAAGMQTTVAANGNLEIALAQGSTQNDAVAPEESQVGDSSAAEGQDIVEANVTWGNLVNVSDPTYGISKIALRPALLSSYNRTDYPLNGATYGGDGRVVTTNDRYEFASYAKVEGTADQYYFAAGDKVNYGVRAISSVGYTNVTGNVRITNYIDDTNQLYRDAQDYYGQIVAGEPNEVNTLDEAEGVTCISALEGLVTVFAQDKINAMGLGRGESTKTSCSPHLWYLYQMMLLLENALEKEGKALLELANWQAYVASGDNKTENTFATIDLLLDASDTELKNKGVTISTLAGYKKSLADLKYCIDGLKPMAEKCKNPDAPEETYYWENISTYVNRLVEINTTTMNGIALKDAGKRNALTLIKGGDVIVYNGALVDIEKRLVNDQNRVQANVQVTAYTSILGNQTVKGTVYTDAYGKDPSYSVDIAYAEGLESGAKGDASAKDTYGLALDVWVRTNYPDAVLTLEGAAKYEDQRATIKIDGTTYELYTISIGEGDTQTDVDVYQKDEKWYYASNMSEVPSEDLGSQTPKEKYVPLIVGYEGENRVWEDWRELLEDGYIEQDATTQGAGSCFVFYADTPTEQAKIMEMLDAFNVAFMDQNGAILGTAKLNLDSAYANQGKVTVPLEVETGTDYTDETGKTQMGITRLTQNTPTMITAIVYLNGSKLQNENVLAEGELQGQLNIQFGTDSILVAPDNEELQAQARTITAEVTVNGETISNGTIGGTNGLEYKVGGYPATVNLTVKGEQPERISGFFVRVINSTQGTRGEEKSFTRNEDGTWSATFTLENPGMYAFNTLIVDGVQYTLHDGTEQSGMNEYYPANRPYVHIRGLKITSASVGVTPGTHMTAESSITFPVTVKVEAAEAVKPKRVNAQFFNEDNTKQYTAILTYDSDNDLWVGSTDIDTSDTYTLKYISVDDNTLDAPATGSYTLYLGLTARVSTSVPEANRKYMYDEEDADGVQLPMIVQIFDDSHQPIEKLTDVLLYYNNMISPAEMEWNGAQYTGVLDATEAGKMTFQKLVIGDVGTVTNVNNAPVFTAVNTKPSSYVAGSGSVTPDKKVVIGEATPAKVTVQLSNGQTATAWAKMENIIDDTVVGVKYVKGIHNVESQNHVTFDVPKEDGLWKVTEIRLQNCYDSVANWYEDTGAEPTESDSIVFVMSAEDQTKMTTDIVATYSFAVYYDEDGDGFETSEELTSSKTFNLTGTPDAPTGTLLKGYAPKQLGVVVLDYAGRSVDGITSTAENADNKWIITYDESSDIKYGGYDGASVAKEGINCKFTLASNVEVGDKTYESMLVTEEQILTHSGVYTVKFQVKPGLSADTLSISPKFTIATKKPTVKVKSISPGAGTTQILNCAENPRNGNFKLMEGDFFRKSDYMATVYIYHETESVVGAVYYNAKLPSVTLELSDISNNFSSATMMFENSDSSTYNKTYTFTPTNKAPSNSIGGVVNKTGTDTEIYPAGNHTVSNLAVTAGELKLDVTLSNPVSISQPQYPNMLSFEIGTNPDAEGKVLTLPNVVDKKIAEYNHVTGKDEVVLPVIDNWVVNVDEVLEPEISPTTDNQSTVYTVCEHGENGHTVVIWKETRYNTYTRHTYVHTETGDTINYDITYRLEGWLIDGEQYNPGDVVGISGLKAAIPVIVEESKIEKKRENKTIQITELQDVLKGTCTRKSGSEASILYLNRTETERKQIN